MFRESGSGSSSSSLALCSAFNHIRSRDFLWTFSTFSTSSPLRSSQRCAPRLNFLFTASQSFPRIASGQPSPRTSSLPLRNKQGINFRFLFPAVATRRRRRVRSFPSIYFGSLRILFGVISMPPLAPLCYHDHYLYHRSTIAPPRPLPWCDPPGLLHHSVSGRGGEGNPRALRFADSTRPPLASCCHL